MALVCRHVPTSLRIATGVLLVTIALSAARVAAQQSSAPSVPTGQPAEFTPLPTADRPVVSTQERVLDIVVVGNNTIKREKVLANMGTHIDHPFDQTMYEQDVRKLSSKNWFVHVKPKVDRVQGGVIITLEVVERPVLQYVRFDGCERIKPTKLKKEVGLAKGDPMDPYAVQDGARKIESYYQSKGFNDVKVTIAEGTNPGDRGARYLIREGVVQKFSHVRFEGNSPSIAPDGRLKTLIQSKTPILGIFKGHVDRKKIEEDVVKLTDYYRSLGFFKAHIGREYEFNEKEDRMELVFHIYEGPQYKIRNISFIGNKVFDEEALTYDTKLKGGQYFNQTRMNSDIGNFKDIYGSHGYVFADAIADLQFFEEPGELDIVYQVTEGKQYRIGEVNVEIKGENPHTKYNTVLNRTSMRPGDIADIRQFRNTERRLKASGLYNVDPSKGETPRVVFSPPDSEEAIALKKKKSGGKRTGNPDSFRGQSPDSGSAPPTSPPAAGYGSPAYPPVAPQPKQGSADSARTSPGYPATRPNTPNYQPSPAIPQGVPAYPQGYPQGYPSAMPGSATDSAPLLRGQSPDGGAYGGRGINSVPPGAQPYTANQAPSGGYLSQPQASNGYGQPGTGYAPGYGQGPPSNGYGQPGYPPSNGAPGGVAPPGYSSPPILPPPGDFLSPAQELDQPEIPVSIVVNEAQTGKFMFGAGVNSNAGLVGSIILDEQNFDWRRVPTSWEDWRTGRAFRGAGQKFRLEAAPGTVVQRYMFNFTEPYLFDTKVSLGLSAFYYNRYFRDWMEQRTGGRTSFGYQFSPDLSGTVALRAEDILVSQPRVPGVPPLEAVLGHTQLYSVITSMAHDTRDSTFLATEGHYIDLGFEYAMGTFQYPRFTTNARKHFLLKERPDSSGRHTLSLYNQFGIAGNDTPIYEAFYAGGFSTLRGFQFRGASPQVDTVLVGGNFMNLSSVEYMFPITADDMLKGVIFCDFGTVEPTIHDITWSDYRIAPGLGLRVTIPMISPAPIALDFAFPWKKAEGDLTQVFSFFVGVGH